MTPRALEVFRATIMTGSVTAAANMLHVSQPAVSRIIHDLETDVGFQLFERRRGRIYPTSEALTLFEEVQRSFIGIERISEVARQIATSRAGRLSVATLPALANTFVPTVVENFVAVRPNVVVSVPVSRSETIMKLVGSRQCDFGLVATPLEGAGTELRKLYRSDCVCILPPGHPLGKKEIIKPIDLKGQPFVSLGEDTITRMKVDAMFRNHGIQPRVRVQTPLSHVVASFVQCGLGISIIDPFTAHAHALRGGIVRPFSVSIRFEFGVLFSTHHRESLLEAAFLEVLHEQFRLWMSRQPSSE